MKFKFHPWTIPIALLGVGLLSFAPLVTRLGLYWDDWPSIWFLHFFGPGSFQQSFVEDRPLLAWVFMFTTGIIGESPLGWQIFGIFTRWLAGLAFWWTLRLVWHKQTLATTCMAMLFMVYPGFRQQFISVTYSNAFLVYAVYLVSVALMLMAIRKPGWRLPGMLLSIMFSGFCLFISEYFFGLELLRPVFLWLAQAEQPPTKRERLIRVVRFWSPYLLLMAGFAFWRVFLHPTPRAEITLFDQLSSTPLAALLDLLKTIGIDLIEVSLLAWGKTLDPSRVLDFDGLLIGIYLAIMLAGAALIAVYLSKLHDDPKVEPGQLPVSKHWAWQAFLAGLWGIFMAGWPIWVTNLRIELSFPSERFTYMMMVGASILLVGLVELISPRRVKIFIIAGLVALAAGLHFQDAVEYRQEWLDLRSFMWQLTWRAPQIEPGTMLITASMSFNHYSDNSLIAPINWTYAPTLASDEMPYALFDLEARMGNLFTGLEPGILIEYPYRAAKFSGSTSKALVLFFSPPRCLKVLEPDMDNNLPYKPDYLPPAMPLSNLNLILPSPTQPAVPPKRFFGNEPDHDWCYYFEKAELAAQIGDWEQVVRLAEGAFNSNREFGRETASELTPFIRGYAYTGEWNKAIELSLEALKASAKMQNLLCTTWFHIQQDTLSSPMRDSAIEEIRRKVICPLP